MIAMLQGSNDTSKALAFALYAFSGLIMAWHPVVKTYPWTNLFLLSGLYFAFRFSRSRRYPWALLSGIAFGLAANIRLTLLPLVLPAAAFVVLNADAQKLRNAAVFTIGVTVASAYSLLLMTQDFDRFFFDNLGFHLIRYPGISFWQSVAERLITIGKLLINPQHIVTLIVLALSFMAVRRERARFLSRSFFRSRDKFIFLMLGLIVVIHLVPNPIHQQYFTQVVPFAVLLVPRGLDYLAGQRDRFPRAATMVKIALAIYLLGLIPYLIIFLGGIRHSDRSNRIENVRNLCDCIGEKAIEGPLYSEWPIVPVLTGRNSVPGIEFVAYDYGYPLTDSEKRRFHLPVSSDIRELLACRAPSFCVVVDSPHPDLIQVMVENYSLVGQFGRYNLYGRK
jgi:hypothetical protein